MLAKELPLIYDALSSNPTKMIIEDQQLDDDFLDNIFSITEHSKNVRKQFFGRRWQLTEEEYQFVEKVGQVHFKCQKFNQTNLMAPEDIPADKKCECGCSKGFGESLPFCINEEETTFMGPGIIIFFFYTKMMFLAIIMLIFVFGLFAMISNILANNAASDCSSPGAIPFLCQVKIRTSVESKNGHSNLLLGQMILGMIACFLWSVAVRVIRKIGRRKNRVIDEYLDSSADMCIMIENLPPGEYSEEDVIDYMKKKWNSNQELRDWPLKIRGVQIIYKMERVRNMINKIQELAIEISQIVEVKSTDDSKRYYIKKGEEDTYTVKKERILSFYEKLKSFREQFWNQSEFRNWLSAGVTIVEFYHAKQQEKFLEHFGTYKKTVLKEFFRSFKAKYFEKITEQFQGERIKIIKAAEPSDIFWEHCEKKISLYRVLIVWVINLALMGCSFGAQIIVRELKIQNPEIESFGIISIIILNLFNRFIWNVLLSIIFIERNFTKTDNVISAMNKSYVSQVMNIILIPIILHLVLADRIDGANGLAGAIHDYQITAFLFMMVFNFINFPGLVMKLLRFLKCTRRFLILLNCRVTGELDTYEEMRDTLVAIYTPPNVPIAGFYVYITTVISQAAFFCHLQPVILLYLLTSMILFYYINRYLVLRRCKIPDLIDFVVFETCIGFAMNVPLLYAIGSIMCLSIRADAPNDAYYIPSIMCIFIWIFSTQNFFGVYEKLTNWIVENVFPEESPDDEDKKEGLGLIGKALELAKKSSTKRVVTRRLESYHSSCTTTLIFNMESQLQEAAGPYHNRSRQFCRRFTLNLTAEEMNSKGAQARLLQDHNTFNDGADMGSIQLLKQNHQPERVDSEEGDSEKKKTEIFQQNQNIFQMLVGKMPAESEK